MVASIALPQFRTQPPPHQQLRLLLKLLDWDYNEPFPLGKTCYLKSTIMMDVEGTLKRQIIQTEDFVIN
jgi:hypothetical protein